MFSKQILESSSQGPGDALGQALHDGFAYSNEAVHTHFFVQRVAKVGNKWQAVITIIVVPKMKAKTREEEIVLSYRKEPRREYTLDTPTEDPDEIRHQIEEKLSLEQHMAMERRTHEVEEAVTMELQHEAENDSLSHIYMEVEYEPIFTSIKPKFDFDYVHYIAEGSLWEAAKKLHPDLEMYEATHPSLVEKFDLRPKDLKPQQKNTPEPKRQPSYLEELVDE